MRLDTFLNATDSAATTQLRRAMTVALALEVPHDHNGYTRFYRRVLEQLEAERQDPRHTLNTHLTSAA